MQIILMMWRRDCQVSFEPVVVIVRSCGLLPRVREGWNYRSYLSRTSW